LSENFLSNGLNIHFAQFYSFLICLLEELTFNFFLGKLSELHPYNGQIDTHTVAAMRNKRLQANLSGIQRPQQELHSRKGKTRPGRVPLRPPS